MADLNNWERNKHKVVLIGEPGVGKTSIFLRLKTGEYDENVLKNSIGVDNFEMQVDVQDSQGRQSTVKLSVWDTGGIERFRSATTKLTSLYRGAAAVLFVYSVDDPISLHYLTSYLQDVDRCTPQATKFLLRNKVDLCSAENAEKLSMRDGFVEDTTSEAFAVSNGFEAERCLNMSALTGENVLDGFWSIATTLHEDCQSNPTDNSALFRVVADSQSQPNGCC